jgi:hypothetical protein
MNQSNHTNHINHSADNKIQMDARIQQSTFHR